jgi:hypothetical protein
MKQILVLALAAVVLLIMTPAPGEARVVRFVVEQREKVLDGKSFGSAGAYERLGHPSIASMRNSTS